MTSSERTATEVAPAVPESPALDLSNADLGTQASNGLSEGIKETAVLEQGALQGSPDLIDAVQQEHGHHHASLREKIAAEHAALRAAGREGPQNTNFTPIASSTATSTSTGTSGANEQLHEHILSLLSTTTKKNKGVVTDDAELAEFMRQHPELSQYIKEIQQARDVALKNAQSGQDALQSKDNLAAKLDVIATLLEGSPLAPALRMGDMTARAAFEKASKQEFGDEEGEALARYVWEKAQANVFKTEVSALDKVLSGADPIAASASILSGRTAPEREALLDAYSMTLGKPYADPRSIVIDQELQRVRSERDRALDQAREYNSGATRTLLTPVSDGKTPEDTTNAVRAEASKGGTAATRALELGAKVQASEGLVDSARELELQAAKLDAAGQHEKAQANFAAAQAKFEEAYRTLDPRSQMRLSLEANQSQSPSADTLSPEQRRQELQRLSAQAAEIGKASAELLAREESPSAEEKEAVRVRREALLKEVASVFGADSAAARHLEFSLQKSEDAERANLVSQKAWELQRRITLNEGRYGEEASQRDLREYLASQSDLLSRNPVFKAQLDQHLNQAAEEGRQMRLRCDQAARDVYSADHWYGANKAKLFAAMENRSQLEIKIIRERYQEMYGEHIRQRFESEVSGEDLARVMRAYDGDPKNRGFEGKPIAKAQLDRSFGSPESEKQQDAILSGDAAKQAAILAEDVLKTADAPALAIVSILQQSGVSGDEFNAARKELGYADSMQALQARAVPMPKSGQATLAAQRDEAGIALLQEYLTDGRNSPETLAQFAAIDAAEFGRRIGAVEGRERPDKELLEKLQADRALTLRNLEPLFAQYPGLDEKVVATVEEYRARSRAGSIAEVVRTYGEKIGLLCDDDKQSVQLRRADLESKLQNFLRSQNDFLSHQPEVAERLSATLDAAKQQGIRTMAEVRKAVSHLNAGISGWGTNEAKCYAALQGKTSAEIFLIKQLYKEKYGATLENAVEGDFSDAELDKMHALLIHDHIGIAAADANIALSGFWGVDHEALRSTLRSLKTSDDRSAFKERFDGKYAGEFFKAGATEADPPIQAKSFEEVLSFQMSGDKLIAAQSLFEGNFNRADAAIVHIDLDGFWGPDFEAAAKHVEAMKNPDGHLDMARITAVDTEFKKQYGSGLGEITKQSEVEQRALLVNAMQQYSAEKVDPKSVDLSTNSTVTSARWLGALVQGNEVDAQVHKLRYAMGASGDGTDEKLLREPFSSPPDLAVRARFEEEHGGVTPETQARLDEWSSFRRAVVSRYSAPDMYAGRELLGDLRDELNDHEFRMVSILMNDGKLSRADMLFDACDGAGTDEDTVKSQTAGLSKAEAERLAKEFELKGYGDLKEVLTSELSGDDEFDVLENIKGRPETLEEMLAAAQRRYDHETSGWVFSIGQYVDPTCGLLGDFCWGEQRKEMEQDLAKLKALAAGNGDPYAAAALYERYGVSAGAFRDQKDMVANSVVAVGTTVVMVGGTVVIIVGSGGTATPGVIALWGLEMSATGAAVGLAGATGVVGMGTKFVIRGDGYGGEEALMDLGETGLNMAVAGSSAWALTKIPVGGAVASRVQNALGELAIADGQVVVAENGARLTGNALVRYTAESSRTIRIVTGAVQGSVDGGIIAPIQAAAVTGIHEQTWNDGFGTGLTRMGQAGINAIPSGVIGGGVFGAATGIRTPEHIRDGKPLSVAKAEAARTDPKLSEEGRQLLFEREAAKGFLTKGDVKAARAVTAGEQPGTYQTAITVEKLETYASAARQDVERITFELSSGRLSPAEMELRQLALGHARSRVSALDQLLAVGEAAAVASAPALASQSAAAVDAKSDRSNKAQQRQDDVGTSSSDSVDPKLKQEISEKQELVRRLERDVEKYPQGSNVRQTIEEGLAKQRELLSDLQAKATPARSVEPEQSAPRPSTSRQPKEAPAMEKGGIDAADNDIAQAMLDEVSGRGISAERTPQRGRPMDDAGLSVSDPDVDLGGSILEDMLPRTGGPGSSNGGSAARATESSSPRQQPRSTQRNSNLPRREAPALERSSGLDAADDAIARSMFEEATGARASSASAEPAARPGGRPLDEMGYRAGDADVDMGDAILRDMLSGGEAPSTGPGRPTSSRSGRSAEPEITEDAFHYDPSESFAAEQEAAARGDFDEPLSSGFGGGTSFDRGPGPSGGGAYDGGSGGPQLQRAPQSLRTSTMVAEAPAPTNAMQPKNMRAEGPTAVLDEPDLDLGQALFEDALTQSVPTEPAVKPSPVRRSTELGKQERDLQLGDMLFRDAQAVPVAEPEVGVLRPAAKPAVKPETSPSIEEILQPQFDQPQMRPEPIFEMQPQMQAATPGLAVAPVIKAKQSLLTDPSPTLEERPQPLEEPFAARVGSPRKVEEEPNTRRRRRNDGVGSDYDPKESEGRKHEELKHEEKPRKHAEHHKGGSAAHAGRRRFVHVDDGLGDNVEEIEEGS